MAYVDYDYYTDKYHGEPIAEDEFQTLSERSGEIVEELTLYRLTPDLFTSLPESHQERVKKAVCAQIEYLEANGGAEMDNGASIQSATLGKFSYSSGAGADGSSGQSVFSPRAERLLWPTGLTYRGGWC